MEHNTSRNTNEINKFEHDETFHVKKVSNFASDGEGNLEREAINKPIYGADTGSVDAFGRWRTSEPTTVFDSKQLYDNLPLLYDDQEVSGSGTGSTHNPNTASSTMTVSGSTAGKRIRQSFMSFNYQPGKSQLIFCTFVMDKSGGGTGIKRGVGYYNDDNGVFLRDNEGTHQVVIRSSTTGSAVDNAIDQTDWNHDKMDGTGVSGITLDFTKSQILIIDFEWLGVGRVRVGFVVDGKIYYCHHFNHANNLDEVYMSTPNLPIRYEIENTGLGAASSLEHICSSVISEGGQQKVGILRHYDSGAVTGLQSGSAYVVMAGRLKSTHIGATLNIENLSITGSQNDQAHWEFRIGGTVDGTLTYSGLDNSIIEVATGASSNTITGGTEIDGGYFTTDLPPLITVPNAVYPGASIDGTTQAWYLVVKPITNNITIRASVTWRELL